MAFIGNKLGGFGLGRGVLGRQERTKRYPAAGRLRQRRPAAKGAGAIISYTEY